MRNLSDEKPEKLEKARLQGITTLKRGAIAHEFRDPFSPGKSLPLAYYTNGSDWVLSSPGPDKIYDLVPAEFFKDRPFETTPDLLALIYDPTNGMFSEGDIVLLSKEKR